MEPQKIYFEDDGKIPNNTLPLLLYKNAFEARGEAGAAWLEQRFSKNNWTNSWRNGVFDYHHYHSNTHEVLGVYSGKARLQLGGESGQKMEVSAGDVIVIPAGVGHKNLGSENFQIVGAYPNGKKQDMNYGKEGERPQADKNIVAVPVPQTDPLFGKEEGVPKIWKDR
ncbi:cupin domain-containing protein [Salinimicrobium marinum]|nr:cupin domain-containing protein [Salinimicrobium marinum]